MNPSARVGYRLTLAAVVALLGVPLSLQPARAGVIQRLRVQVSDQRQEASVFGVTSNDITQDIFLDLTNNNPAMGLQGRATGAIDRFGSLGLTLRALGAALATDPTVRASVLIGSDDFVNLTSSPQTVIGNVIIDGGQLRLFVARDVEIEYRLRLGLGSRGGVPGVLLPPETSQNLMTLTAEAQATSSPAVDMGGILAADGNFQQTFSTSGGGLDATATFEPENLGGIVDIPVSIQSFNLGTVSAGNRFIVGYLFELQIRPRSGTLGGFTEEALAEYSDPLNLSGNPAFRISFAPVGEPSVVPEPCSVLLIGSGGLVLLVHAWRRRQLATD
ncbi:MAG: hypothetical protein L0Z62_49815 [Gemmataceae bacterium]|nr:hypothetical protein [Gemmataceae bacterium]